LPLPQAQSLLQKACLSALQISDTEYQIVSKLKTTAGFRFAVVFLF
jgi:hypothetical protein